jgi:hypothetical protein
MGPCFGNTATSYSDHIKQYRFLINSAAAAQALLQANACFGTGACAEIEMQRTRCIDAASITAAA